jgi:hypothetical protein
MDLEDRVAELERRTIRYRNALVMLVVGVCAVAVIGATTDDGVLQGRYLFLRNEQGEIVIAAGVSDTGNGQLVVSSKTGTDWIYAGGDTDGNGLLRVISKTGTDLIRAGANITGHGGLTVKSKAGTDLIYMGGGSRVDNGFFFNGFNKTGESVVHLYADGNGNGALRAYNRKGESKTLKPGP